AAHRAPDAKTIASDALGHFETAAPELAGRFLAGDERYATVLAGLWQPATQRADVVVVVAPSLAFAGTVRADDGAPLADARVGLLMRRELRSRIAAVLDESAECGWIARSDHQGRFELPDVPAVDGAQLKASLEGWITEFTDAPASSSRAIEIVLHRPAS